MEAKLTVLEQQVEVLIKVLLRLKEENALLRQRQSTIQQERDELLNKNHAAKAKLRDMITRLKGLEEQA